MIIGYVQIVSGDKTGKRIISEQDLQRMKIASAESHF